VPGTRCGANANESSQATPAPKNARVGLASYALANCV
jgi:hypothetical protein